MTVLGYDTDCPSPLSLFHSPIGDDPEPKYEQPEEQCMYGCWDLSRDPPFCPMGGMPELWSILCGAGEGPLPSAKHTPVSCCAWYALKSTIPLI